MRLLALALLATPFVTGCGPCQKIAAHRDAFHGRSAEGQRPHLSVLIPQKMIDDGIQAGIDKIRPKGVNIPGLGKLSDYVGQVKFLPKRVKVSKAAQGRFRIGMDLDVGLDNRTLFTMSLGTETRPQANTKSGELVLPFRADMLESVKPTVGSGAGRKLADAMLAKVPSLARRLIPRSEVNRIADKAVDYLSDNAVRLLRREVLTPMGELASLKFKMPDIPLQSLEMVSVANGLAINARTSLPVQGGLAAPSKKALSALRTAPTDEIQVRFSVAAVVELANWGISRGDIPGRYSMQGKPDPKGSFTAGLAWAGGQRPLKVNAWSTEGTCIRARLAARPRVALSKGKLDIGVDDATVEEIEGPPLISTAVEWSRGLWDDSIKTAKTKIETSEFGLGKGAAKGVGLGRIALEGDALVIALTTGKSKKASTTRRKRVSWVAPAPAARCGG